ncbi:hypothetical protein NEUTE1DRAFT_98019 [Neurospora tetrasperma FGSC 2508]|uniref:Uncharacterized protein n=1 Tax=Neurospora tetrasperma (strain FGSC 2508 / ATCC MYA-4615 / P0657) TaxID=510951 RepID=F8MET7_NEUT8|nr:uncharacterized protein NEUTE1DRAFT_98019 [Neurospora tetrasperma FGSC 2508]EGO60861.1 hypothetical protein NEUTE1DRAFT_98019 [Neurospora tetrasperma FGSC 2508]EGZ75147.1 hypothetical protein NEUTE2DRAFT_126088 [Neurospora tetrasperma FGSC 2509]
MPGQGSLCLLAGRRWKTRSDEMVLRKTGGKSGRRERRVEVRFKIVDDGDLCCKVNGARLLEEDARLSKRRCPGFIVGSGKPTAALVAALTVQGLH